MKKAVVAGVAATLLIPLFVVVLLAAALSHSQSAGASEQALADIPADMVAIYQRAATTCPGLPWQVLAAIGKVETDHGRSTLPGVHSGANAAGAMGPMQFLAPTWAVYGADGDGDGQANVYDADDAVFGAANYLCANGGGEPTRLRDAVWNYNHSQQYVDEVLTIAAQYTSGGVLGGPPPANVAEVLAHPNLTLTDRARADLQSGNLDARLVSALGASLARHRLYVTVFKTGHSMCVGGGNRTPCNVSNHYEWRAMDVFTVDGVRVSQANPAAREFSIELANMPGGPDEIGQPWYDLESLPGVFANASHQDHVHAGYER